jgi:hypothetical protein
MIRKIEPINIWIDGQVKTAEWFELYSTYDNLKSTASFSYKLFENKVDDEGYLFTSIPLNSGTLYMSLEEYIDWSSQSGDDVNDWVYNWAASKLSLIVVQ